MENNLPFDNEIDSLITACLSGNANGQDLEILNLWLEKSSDNKKYFRSFCEIWQLSGGVLHESESLAEIPVDSSRIFMENQRLLNRNRLFKVFRYAALFILILSAGFFLGRKTSSGSVLKNEAGNIAAIYAPMGSKAMSLLPDGTQIWLNAGSTITYNTKTYNQHQRAVTLTGEAYFKVKSNALKPFIVNAKGFNVKALGTEFNVKAYPEEKEVVTTLVKGIVNIEGKDQYQKSFVVQMKPKQIVKLEAGISSGNPKVIDISERAEPEKLVKQLSGRLLEKPVVVNDVNTSKYTSWKDNQWMLEGEEVGNLVVMLERKYNVSIHVKSAELTKYKFTGTFKNETLEQVLSVLKIAIPVKYTIGKGTVSLDIDPVSKDKYRKFIRE